MGYSHGCQPINTLTDLLLRAHRSESARSKFYKIMADIDRREHKILNEVIFEYFSTTFNT